MFAYLLNFLLVYISIILFALPFFVWYYIRSHETRSLRDFNIILEDFFKSKQSNWLVFVWAASEAVVWFVIPEFLLLLVIFMRVQRKRQLLIYDVAGTVVGTLAAFLIRLPEHILAQLPYVQEGMIAQTKIWYNDMGILGLANQPFSGVPYKVFTHLGWDYNFTLLTFIIVAVSVRMFRYIVAYGLFMSLYPRLHTIVKGNYVPLASIAILIFSVLLYNTYNIYR